MSMLLVTPRDELTSVRVCDKQRGDGELLILLSPGLKTDRMFQARVSGIKGSFITWRGFHRPRGQAECKHLFHHLKRSLMCGVQGAWIFSNHDRVSVHFRKLQASLD